MPLMSRSVNSGRMSILKLVWPLMASPICAKAVPRNRRIGSPKFQRRRIPSGLELLHLAQRSDYAALISGRCLRLEVGRCSLPLFACQAVIDRLHLRRGESRSRKSEQRDKWSFCLTASKISPRIRRDDEQETTPESHTKLQGQGGACRHQGRDDAFTACGAF